jgi:protein TonB
MYRAAVVGLLLAFALLADEPLVQVRPIYPELAIAARIEGTVRLVLRVDETGRVQRVRLISGHPFLVQAAIDAARQWRYRPTLINRKPVVVAKRVAITFSIGREPRVVTL